MRARMLAGERGLHALVDPMLGEPLADIEHPPNADASVAQRTRERVWQRAISPVSLHPKVKLAPARCPYLVELDGPQDEWLAHTLHYALKERAQAQRGGLHGSGGAPQRIGGWLTTNLFAAQLAQQLAALLCLDTEARTDARYLRLADARVLDWTRQVLGERRLSAALGRIQTWQFIDILGNLGVIASADEQSRPLRFAQREWASMERGEAAHRAVAMALGEAAASRISLTDPYARVIDGLDSADQAAYRWPPRFTDVRDRHVWAALYLLYGTPDDRVDVRAVMDAAPAPEDEIEPVRELAAALAAALGVSPSPQPHAQTRTDIQEQPR